MVQIKRLSGARDDIFMVNNMRYLAPYQQNDPVFEGSGEPGLATVIIILDDRPHQLTGGWLQDMVERYKACDDVFGEEFLSGIIFSGAKEGDIEVALDAQEYLTNHGNKWVKFFDRDAWLLQDDTSDTLMASLRPQDPSSDLFETFSLTSADSQFLCIPLRSRLKAQHSSSSPISGWRIFVKDNIDVKGVKTSPNNRAYYDLYPPRSETAASVRRAIGRGAIVSGKTKLNSFGDWEEPLEYIDYQAPWNPRGDGYQSTGGSSSGSAAAVSSYEWLDIANGTDTWGSVTRPAQCMLRTFTIEWLLPDALTKSPKLFSTIIWASDFWSIIDNDQVEHTRRFVSEIEKTLGIPTTEISFVEQWANHPPPEAMEAHSLSLLMRYDRLSHAPACQGYDAYHNEDDFRKRYQAEYHKHPYIGLRLQQSWASAENMTQDERDDGYARIAIYKKWFGSTILANDASDALIVIPQENIIPRYRDENPCFRRPPQDGICAMALAAVLNAPALTVPIGQIPYQSRVSRNEEYLPLTVTLFLLETTQRILEAAQLPTTVKTGKVMFDVLDQAGESK
ncbi:amidase signature enzyme [Ophiobolus disseminans]|uniref:Amidase signature enzyme n=1 Tax=Ophiobolus disseminans TaxID=1469910 RepID=A0A6A7A2E0_9PLEO|nr:amidase signature enzyme [Ophiobolus disseminans]